MSSTDYVRERQVEEYERQLGQEALVRQVSEATRRFTCCGESRDGQHHVLCAKYVEPVIAQDEALF